MANQNDPQLAKPVVNPATALSDAEPSNASSEFGGPELGGSNTGFPVASRSPALNFSFSVLWEAKWWMMATAAVLILVSVPVIWLAVKPTYQARAMVRISPKALRIAFKNEDNSGASYYKTFVNTQVAILRGPTVLQRVLDQEKIRQTRWYQDPPKPLMGAPKTHLERLAEALSTKMHRESELIEVAVNAERAEDAKTLVNAVADEYKRFSDETVREVDTQRYETVVDEYGRLQKEIDGLIRTKFSIAKQLGTASPEELRSQLTTHLSRLEEDHGKVERELRMVQADREWLAKKEQSPDAESGATSEEDARKNFYARDAEWRRLNTKLQDEHHGLELALQQFGEAHPKVRELNTNIEHAQQMLTDREGQLNALGIEGLAAGPAGEEGGGGVLDAAALDRRADRLQKQLDLLREEIGRQREKVASASDLAGDLAQYDEQIRRKRELGETLHARMTELELEGKAPARISVESHATVPSRPDRDRRVLFTVMAVCLALFCGLGVGYVRTVFDPRIREAADVRQSVRVPFLGQLPALPTTQRILDGVTPFLLESVRIVRTAMLERFAPATKGAVLITSSTSGTGKTSLAALLSLSLAALGKKTLLVEADLRRPTLGDRLGLQCKEGLASLLRGATDDRRIIVASGTNRLDVVLAGEVPEDFDPELLANGTFDSAMGRWRKAYDIIIVDSPPVLPVADARILARQTDGTLMILRSSHTRRDDVVQAYSNLSEAGGALLGTVLVGVRAGAGYGGYDEGYYGHARPRRALEAVS